MKLTLGFDVYGTLIDTHGVIKRLQEMVGDGAAEFSALWREKQLEYTFRRGLMDQYRNFGVCTRDALNYTARHLGHELSDQQKQTLIAAYASLPAFDDAVAGLESVKQAGMAMFAFSNGQAEAVNTVLKNAGIRDYFEGVVSVDSVGTFKPSPRVYAHFISATGCDSDDAWLISSNGFDAIGAAAFGMHAAWVQRSASVVLDPWEFEPDLTLDSLDDLATRLIDHHNTQGKQS